MVGLASKHNSVMTTKAWKPIKGRSRGQTGTNVGPAVVGVGIGVAAVGLAAVGYAVHKTRARSPVSLPQWRNVYTGTDGSICSIDGFLDHVQEKGMDADVRKEAWPYLLGLFKPHEGAAERAESYEVLHSAFTTLLRHCQDLEAAFVEATTPMLPDDLDDEDTACSPSFSSVSSPLRPRQAGRFPQLSHLSTSDVPTYLRQYWEAQRILVMDAIRTDFKKNTVPAGTTRSSGRLMGDAADGIASFFTGGLMGRSNSHDRPYIPSLPAAQRTDASFSGSVPGSPRVPPGAAGLFGLGSAPWGDARHEGTTGRGMVWLSSIARHHLEHASHFTPEMRRQVERLVTLLSAYAVHDPTTGYCQGMSDLALSFVLLFEDDTLAFWCFERLMRKARANFAHDDAGIFHSLAQLGALLEALDPPLAYHLRALRASHCHFAYRMLVVLMRRELSPEALARLWEQLWADDLLRARSGTTLRDPSATGANISAGVQQLPFDARPSALGCVHASASTNGGLLVPQHSVDCSTIGLLAGQCDDGKDAHSGQGQASGSVWSSSSPAGSVYRDRQLHHLDEEGAPASPQPLLQSRQQPETSPSPPTHGLDSRGGAPMARLVYAALQTPPAAQRGASQNGSGREDNLISLDDEGLGGTSGASQQQQPQPSDAAGGECRGELASPQGAQPLLLFFVAAVVTGQRRRILDECRESDDVLRLFQVPQKIDVQDCLRRASDFRARIEQDSLAVSA